MDGTARSRLARGLGACALAAALACDGPTATSTPTLAQRNTDLCRVLGAGEAAEEPHPGKRWTERLLECARSLDYQRWERDARGKRLTGPFVDGRGFTTHQRVQVYYSAGMAAWLRGELDEIPLGARMVKEMFVEDPSDGGPDEVIDGIAYMERTDGRTGGASNDRWFWGLYFRPGSPTFGGGPGFASAQHGVSFCLTCHSLTREDDATFAWTGNLDGSDVVSYTWIPRAFPPLAPDAAPSLGPHGSFAMVAPAAANAVPGCLGADPRALPCDREWYPTGPAPASDDAAPKILLGMAYNDFVPTPHFDSADERRASMPLVSSDACQSCHDVSLLQNARPPAMFVVGAGDEQYNLSPWGEWSASLMARSARDPVFLAQLESELEAYPDHADRISTLCLSCHGAMGVRQLRAEQGDDARFEAERLYARPGEDGARYASLARNGVSCAVCHRIVTDDFDPDTHSNARFELGPGDLLYGPFEAPNPFAMERALGVTPVHGEQVRSSELCGACHTVRPPIVRGHEDEPWDELPHANEQSTYLEWANSRWSAPGPEGRTCSGCHMPDRFGPAGDEPLRFAIANVTGPDFAYQHAQASPEQLELGERDYRRHTLGGINAVVLEAFRLQPSLLGVTDIDIGIPQGERYPRAQLAVDEALRFAREETATLELEVTRRDGALEAEVTVRNLAGHKLPSGVHFRRAWLELAVRAEPDAPPLWCSGCSDDDGWIVGRDGTPLASERATAPAELEPRHEAIASPDQAQVYEERFADPDRLTTSFLALAARVKDTRILPEGWSAEHAYADETWPLDPPGTRRPDPDAGRDRVLYRIPLDEVAGAQRVEARLVYQPLPPYYLAELPREAGREREKLHTVLDAVRRRGRDEVRDGRLEVARAAVPLE